MGLLKIHKHARLSRSPFAATAARSRCARLALLSLVLCMGPGVAMATPGATGSPSPAALEADIRSFSQAAHGDVGVAAWRLDGHGPRVLVNATEPFPMASTFKVAVAGAFLSRVDAGERSLTQMVTMDPARFVPSEVIADRFIHAGVALSAHNLLELMLTQSDNTATDAVVELAGGPAAVTDWLRRQGISGQRVDRDTAGIIREFFGLPAGNLGELLGLAASKDADFDKRDSLPNPAFDNDARDTSTPVAMAELLTRLFNGQALTPGSTGVLTATMERCRTGSARLRGLLPASAVVAHKTGTIGGTVNDVGVITLPGDAGRIVIAVYIKKSTAPMEVRERTIAEIARSVRDFYLYAAAASPQTK